MTRTTTMYRVRITLTGVEKKTAFYTGSPIVFFLPKFFGRKCGEDGAETARDNAASRIKATYPPGTKILAAEVVEATVDIPRPARH